LATKSLNSRKAIGPLHLLWVHFAKFYEQGGVLRESEPDLTSCRKVFEKATKVWFRKVEELAEVWCEWAEMEVRNENYEEAIKVMMRASTIPSNWKSVDYRDESLPPQQRLFKSLKLWSFYVDLEESIGTVESTKKVYDQIFTLKIANAQVFINAANFLEENEYWEESFKIYEQGVDLLPYPIAFEIWNAYLSKFIKRYVSFHPHPPHSKEWKKD
jgi:pre-mRNA-splicing factor SYF1